jgi:LytR cell envelope-related transcriptional attenuator
MRVIPFAFSVHHFITTVGADAGFAAIIGLAILVLLYFAQARETKSLREQAHQADEQLQQLELRIAELSRTRPSSGATTSWPQPALAPAPAGISHPIATSVMAVPAAPAGVGAPALTAATRLIPAAGDAELAVGSGTGTEAALSHVATDRGTTSNTAVVSAPPPSTTAGGGNGVSADRTPRPVGGPIGRPGGPPPRRPHPPQAKRSGPNRGFLLAGGLLAVVAVAAVALIVSSGASSPAGKTVSTAARTTNPTRSSRHRTRTTPLKPASVTVAVLNGTATANLAHTIALRLGAAGYKQGMIATASDQTQTATVVGYLPSHRQAALAVAAALKLGSASVQPVDQSNQAVACPPPSSCAANVVVTVGSDLASST